MTKPENSEKKQGHEPPIMQRGDFRREMRHLAKRCIRELTWSPEEDIAIIIEKYNLDMEKIRKKVLEDLSL